MFIRLYSNILLLVSHRIPNTGHLTVRKLLRAHDKVRMIAGY